MSITDALLEHHEPWRTPDLDVYLSTIGAMFAPVELFVEDRIAERLDDPDGPGVWGPGDDTGWSILLDPDLCPREALPYLAQYVGERLPVGLDEYGQREWIKDAPNQRRGTLESIVAAAQRTLTGERTVGLIERPGGDEDAIAVRTYEGETPDPVQVYRDLRSVVPADIEILYSSGEGQTWFLVGSTYATWQDVADEYDSWDDVRSDEPGWTIWTRPRVTT